MSLSVLTSDKNTPPILIVDKIGAIGEELARQLCQDFLVVLLSPNPNSEKNEKIIHVPFKKRIPQVPDNRYSKIFIVDDGNSVTRQSAFSFIEKAKENDAPLFFVGSIRNVDIAHSDQVIKSYANSKVLIFGDLFDKNIFFGEESINKFILQARKTGKIEVDGNGLSLSFPITFTDTIKLIIKALYLDIPQKMVLLFYPHPITDISLANTFKKIDPEIKVDFVKEKKERKIYIPQGAQHAISKYDLEDKIRELDLTNTENRQIKIINNENRRISLGKPTLFFLLILLFLLLLPFLTTSAYAILGQREIENARKSAILGDFDKAGKQMNHSKTFFSVAIKTSGSLIWEAKLLRMEEDAKKIRGRVQAGLMISQAGIYVLDGSFLIRDIYSGKSRDPKSDFSKASNSLRTALGLIQKTKVEGSLPEDLSQDIDDITPFVDLFSNSENILADILGFEKEKSYMILFQDETNLRPGGGVIGSVAVLKVKNAKITEFSVLDASSVDEELDTNIESPFMLRRYSQIDSLNLENSSSDPEFINNAIAASNIYFLSTKKKVDGVIALDLVFIKNLVSETGPVSVLGENIIENNLFEAHIEQNSLGKGNFIGLVAEALKKDLEKRKDIPYFGLTKQVGKSIREKHLLFASPIASYQNIFTANGWSSSLWDNRIKENNKINDYLGIVEANLGGNSANYFVSRSVSKKIILSDKGKFSSVLEIGFKNNSKEEKAPGTYKNYLQIILPEGTKINSVKIDGKEVKIEKAITDPSIYESSGFKPPSGLEIEERNQIDKSIFGFLVMVPGGSIKTVTISYDLPYSVSPSQKSFNYSLKVYKQPGVTSYPFDLAFDLPNSFRTLPQEKEFPEIKEDQDYQFTIAQK